MVRLDLTIGGEDNTIQWELPGNRVTGSLATHIQGRSAVQDVADTREFEDIVGAHMLSRLGLEPVTSFRSDTGGSGGAIQTLRVERPQRRPLRPQSRPELSARRTQRHSDGLAGRLLQVFVGLPWAPTHGAAQTALKSLTSERVKTLRRANDDRTRADAIAELEHRATTLRDELTRLESADDAAATMDGAAAAFQSAPPRPRPTEGMTRSISRPAARSSRTVRPAVTKPRISE